MAESGRQVRSESGGSGSEDGWSGDEDGGAALFEWAHRYDAYQRIAADPHHLHEVLAPARDHFDRFGSIPDWCGVDLLRAWAFYLARASRFGSPLDDGSDEWRAVVRATRDHPATTSSEGPPRVRG